MAWKYFIALFSGGNVARHGQLEEPMLVWVVVRPDPPVSKAKRKKLPMYKKETCLQ